MEDDGYWLLGEQAGGSGRGEMQHSNENDNRANDDYCVGDDVDVVEVSQIWWRSLNKCWRQPITAEIIIIWLLMNEMRKERNMIYLIITCDMNRVVYFTCTLLHVHYYTYQ